MAACSARCAIADDGPRRRPDPGWLVRTASRPHEPCRSITLDSLARPVDLEPAGGGKLLLHGVSVCFAANSCPPLPAAGSQLAALAAEQVAGGEPARTVPVGL